MLFNAWRLFVDKCLLVAGCLCVACSLCGACCALSVVYGWLRAVCRVLSLCAVCCLLLYAMLVNCCVMFNVSCVFFGVRVRWLLFAV